MRLLQLCLVLASKGASPPSRGRTGQLRRYDASRSRRRILVPRYWRQARTILPSMCHPVLSSSGTRSTRHLVSNRMPHLLGRVGILPGRARLYKAEDHGARSRSLCMNLSILVAWLHAVSSLSWWKCLKTLNGCTAVRVKSFPQNKF